MIVEFAGFVESAPAVITAGRHPDGTKSSGEGDKASGLLDGPEERGLSLSVGQALAVESSPAEANEGHEEPKEGPELPDSSADLGDLALKLDEILVVLVERHEVARRPLQPGPCG
ncbi:MAG: hypothetical protein AB1486_34165 [Planctomycetota bacterium]